MRAPVRGTKHGFSNSSPDGRANELAQLTAFYSSAQPILFSSSPCASVFFVEAYNGGSNSDISVLRRAANKTTRTDGNTQSTRQTIMDVAKYCSTIVFGQARPPTIDYKDDGIFFFLETGSKKPQSGETFCFPLII